MTEQNNAGKEVALENIITLNDKSALCHELLLQRYKSPG